MTAAAAATEPSTLTIAAPGLVDLVAAPAGGKRPRFEILGYTGAPMQVEGFFSPVILDLDGMRAASQAIPALRDHDTGRVVGQTESVAIGKQGVALRGVVTGDNEDAREIVSQARNGFRWQASVGAAVVRREFLDAGKSARVNGRDVTGPMVVVRESVIKEISFVAIGADGDTEASIAAKGGRPMPTETTEHVETTPAPNVEATAPDPVAAERARVREILSLCGPGDHDIQAAAIGEGWGVDRVRAELLTRMRAGRANAHVAIGTGAPRAPAANPRDRIAAAALLMAGHGESAARHFGERLVASIHRPRGWAELCAFALAAEGRDVPRDRHELLASGFSTVSLPTALGLGVHKLALDTFTEMSINWRSIGRPVSVGDFKDGHAIRLTTATRLEELGAGGEIKHGVIGEEVFDFRVKTYARMLQLTRNDIINDDLNLLDDLPRVLGAESARLVSDLVFDAIIANTDASGDFYSTAHANLIHEALDFDGLAEAVRILRTRRDADGRIIGYVPATLLVPAALEQTARALLNSTALQRDQTADRQPTANPLNGLNLGLAVEPRLDDDSETDWYLFARPSDSGILVAFLDGRQGVTVESQPAPFHVLGHAWRAYMDVGVTLAESRATVKSDVEPYADQS